LIRALTIARPHARDPNGMLNISRERNFQWQRALPGEEISEVAIEMAKHDRRIAQMFGVTFGCLFAVALILNALAF
jgi:hypothetical protein